MKFLLSAATLALILAVTASTASAAYSNAQYSYSGSPYGFWIHDYKMKIGTNTIQQNLGTGLSATYNSYYSGISPANMIPGTQHTIEIKNGTGTYSYPMYFTVWIDYNNDSTWNNTNEKVATSQVFNTPSGTQTVTFTPPTNVGGVLRMRIRIAYSQVPTDPIANMSYGEAEDYDVNLGFAISTQSPLPAAAQGSTYNQTIQATNGTVPYTWNTNITGLPPGINANQSGNNLVLSGNPTSVGTYNFNVSVDDSATPTPDNATGAFQITVVPPPAAMPFLDSFSTDKGWQPGTTWSRGACVAYSGTSPPRAEPTTDYSPSSADNMIMADTRGGDYQISQGTTHYAISPMVNCTNATNVRLRFFRWLGCSIGTDATIDVSNNGVSWTNLWSAAGSSGQSTIRDTAWQSIYFDISSVAAGAATVQVRFGIGPTSSSPHTGWCIDDFQIEEPGPDLEVREGGTGGTVITDNQAVGGLRDFGIVNVSTQAPLQIALTNNGPQPISLAGFTTTSKTGANPGDFTLQLGGVPQTLAVGSTVQFTIIFYRTTQGVSTATIQVPHNANGSGTAPFDINVRGEAVVPIPDLQANQGSATGTQINHQDAATGTPRDFGSQDINAGPTAPIEIWITNVGTGVLSLTIDMGGTWWTQFQVSTVGTLSQLSPGASTSFEVTFDPSSTGAKDATIRIVHNDGSKPSPFLIPVLGNGTNNNQAAIGVHEGSASGPQLAHNDPAANGRDFGNRLVSAGPSTPPLTITIKNNGGAALTLGAPTIGGPGVGHYIINTAGYSNSLNPGASTSFTVAFDPQTIGNKDATISITHNDATVTNPFVINITGVGVTTIALIEVRETNGGGNILSNPAPASGALDFGTRDVNAGPTNPLVIYIANNGTSNLTVGVPSFNPATTEFQISAPGFPASIAPGANATFTIVFDPTTTGTKLAQVQFTHNDTAAGSPYILNVRGDAVLNAPRIEVRETSVVGTVVNSGEVATPGGGRDLGSIDVSAGSSFPVAIVIVNTGTLDLTVGTPTITGPNAADFSISGSPSATVTPGNSTQFDVLFDPSLGGIKDAQIEFTHGDTAAPSPFIVKVMGTAVDPNGVTITTASLPPATAGVPYSVAMAAIQGAAPYVWSLYSGTLPAGITLDAAGNLAGTATGLGGTYTFSVRVTDQNGATHEKQFVLAVSGIYNGKGRAAATACSVTDEGGTSTSLALLALLAMGASAYSIRRRKA